MECIIQTQPHEESKELIKKIEDLRSGCRGSSATSQSTVANMCDDLSQTNTSDSNEIILEKLNSSPSKEKVSRNFSLSKINRINYRTPPYRGQSLKERPIKSNNPKWPRQHGKNFKPTFIRESRINPGSRPFHPNGYNYVTQSSNSSNLTLENLNKLELEAGIHTSNNIQPDNIPNGESHRRIDSLEPQSTTELKPLAQNNNDFFWFIKSRSESFKEKRKSTSAKERSDKNLNKSKRNEHRSSSLSSAASIPSSCDSNRGLVNQKYNRRNVNMCDNQSDMWYGLRTQDGKPVYISSTQKRPPRGRWSNNLNTQNKTNRFKSNLKIVRRNYQHEHQKNDSEITPHHKFKRTNKTFAPKFTERSHLVTRNAWKHLKTRPQHYFPKSSDPTRFLNVTQGHYSSARMVYYENIASSSINPSLTEEPQNPNTLTHSIETTASSNSLDASIGASTQDTITKSIDNKDLTAQNFIPLANSPPNKLKESFTLLPETEFNNSQSSQSKPHLSHKPIWSSNSNQTYHAQNFKGPWLKKSKKFKRNVPKHNQYYTQFASNSTTTFSKVKNFQHPLPLEKLNENSSSSSMRPLISYDDLESQSTPLGDDLVPVKPVSENSLKPVNQQLPQPAPTSTPRQHVQQLLAQTRGL